MLTAEGRVIGIARFPQNSLHAVAGATAVSQLVRTEATTAKCVLFKKELPFREAGHGHTDCGTALKCSVTPALSAILKATR
jgi:hypothetical protein